MRAPSEADSAENVVKESAVVSWVFAEKGEADSACWRAGGEGGVSKELADSMGSFLAVSAKETFNRLGGLVPEPEEVGGVLGVAGEFIWRGGGESEGGGAAGRGDTMLAAEVGEGVRSEEAGELLRTELGREA